MGVGVLLAAILRLLPRGLDFSSYLPGGVLQKGQRCGCVDLLEEILRAREAIGVLDPLIQDATQAQVLASALRERSIGGDHVALGPTRSQDFLEARIGDRGLHHGAENIDHPSKLLELRKRFSVPSPVSKEVIHLPRCISAFFILQRQALPTIRCGKLLSESEH